VYDTLVLSVDGVMESGSVEIITYRVYVPEMLNTDFEGWETHGLNSVEGLRIDEMPINISDKQHFKRIAQEAIDTKHSFHWLCRIQGKNGLTKSFQTVNIPQKEDILLGIAWEITDPICPMAETFHDHIASLFWQAQGRIVKKFRTLATGLTLKGDTLTIHFRQKGYANAFNRIANQVIPLIGDRVIGAVDLADGVAQVARQ
jgi:hypothetical protein